MKIIFILSRDLLSRHCYSSDCDPAMRLFTFIQLKSTRKPQPSFFSSSLRDSHTDKENSYHCCCSAAQLLAVPSLWISTGRQHTDSPLPCHDQLDLSDRSGLSLCPCQNEAPNRFRLLERPSCYSEPRWPVYVGEKLAASEGKISR